MRSPSSPDCTFKASHVKYEHSTLLIRLFPFYVAQRPIKQRHQCKNSSSEAANLAPPNAEQLSSNVTNISLSPSALPCHPPQIHHRSPYQRCTSLFPSPHPYSPSYD